MGDLEPSDDKLPRTLRHKPMAWLGVIRPLHKGEEFPLPLWQAFFSARLGSPIPSIVATHITTCACKRFQIDAFGDHICTCQSHSGSTRAHDWAVSQLANLFRTTHRVKDSGITTSKGQRRGDIEILEYLADAAGHRSIVTDLRITHDRHGSSAQPHLNGRLCYTDPRKVDQVLEDGAREKIREYRADYANNRGISFLPMVASTSGRVHSELARLLFLQAHRETTKYFEAHGRQLAQTTRMDSFHYKRATFYNAIKSKVGLVLAKAAALRITLNLDGAPIPARAYTHPSHNNNSRLISTALSHHIPLPHAHST